MPDFLIGFIALAAVLRFAALAVSIRNEKRMKVAGAVEYCAGTSTLLAFVHIAYYLAAIAEGVWRGAPVSAITWTGVAVSGKVSGVAVISDKPRYSKKPVRPETEPSSVRKRPSSRKIAA